jgi:hypothetical protein
MPRALHWFLPVVLALTLSFLLDRPAAAELTAGFAEADITPAVETKPVYLAGFGNNRKATGIHDRLKARAVVLGDGKTKLALVSVDLVGFFHGSVLNVRKQLSGFDYVLVSSTHNHEGPDTLGLWGPTTPLPRSGIDPDYMKFIEKQVAQAVRDADKNAKPATARLGSVKAPELLHDGREPYVKHDDLVVLEFSAAGGQLLGVLVQWNNHPETLSSKNTLVSADYVGYTVDALRKKHGCPVAYFTGTVGGLMTSLHVPIKDEQGKELHDGTFEKTERYGLLLAERANEALAAAKPVQLTPLSVRSREIFLPMTNRVYKGAQLLGILDRPSFLWTGDPYKAEPAGKDDSDKPQCIRSEVAILKLGELEAVAIPGEIYPELVLDKVQDPVDPGADFPDAPIEPAVYKQLKGPHRMIFGLANDEIGYILPKRQWDEKPPFCYGRTTAQYGESNSIGPDAGPIICRAIKELAER